MADDKRRRRKTISVSLLRLKRSKEKEKGEKTERKKERKQARERQRCVRRLAEIERKMVKARLQKKAYERYIVIAKKGL